MKGSYLGEFEELLLVMVVILQEDAYVFNLKAELFAQIGRKSTMGSLHATLSRLEKKGLLESEMKGATETRGGRRKRIYQLTAAGKAALQQTKEIREHLWSQVPKFALQISYA